MLDLIPTSMTGFNKLMEELKELEKKADEVRKRVAEAREEGDLKENGAYIYGRQELGFLEGRLGELRTKINRAEKIDCTQVDCEKAFFGTVVTLVNVDTGKKVTYQLLGPNDADVENGSISIETPIGEAVCGLSVGEKGTADIPRGEFNFEIISIEKPELP